jgi:hypothetical protein
LMRRIANKPRPVNERPTRNDLRGIDELTMRKERVADDR